MGILLRDKNADFSSNLVGHAGLYTTVTGNLKALHELRRSAGKTIKNSAPGMLDASIVGTPTYSATSIATSVGNGVIFNTKPNNGGMTVAIILKMKSTGSSVDTVVGINGLGGATTIGAVWFTHYARRVQITAYSYPAGTVPPLSGYAQNVAFQDMASSYDGLYEMFFGVLENGNSLRLYHPKTGNLTTTATSGRDFCFDNPASIKTHPFNTTTAQDQALFAHWESVLTPAQMDKFYAEMKAQYALLGLTI